MTISTFIGSTIALHYCETLYQRYNKEYLLVRLPDAVEAAILVGLYSGQRDPEWPQSFWVIGRLFDWNSNNLS